MPKRRTTRWMPVAILMLALLAPAGAWSDPHDPQESGHPFRVLAYVLHPVGVVIDTVVFRPAHWFVHRADWLETLFGHDDHD